MQRNTFLVAEGNEIDQINQINQINQMVLDELLRSAGAEVVPVEEGGHLEQHVPRLEEVGLDGFARAEHGGGAGQGTKPLYYRPLVGQSWVGFGASP